MGGSITSGIAESATTNGRRRCGYRHEARSGGGNAWEMPAGRRANRWLEQGAFHIAMQPPAINKLLDQLPSRDGKCIKKQQRAVRAVELERAQASAIRGNISEIRQKDGYIAGLCP